VGARAYIAERVAALEQSPITRARANIMKKALSGGPWVWSWVLLGFAASLPTMVLDLFCSSRKTSFSWDSACISPTAAVLSNLAVLFIALVVANPLCLLWRLGDRAWLPARVEPFGHDPLCGVGPYVSLLQGASIIVFAFFSAPTIAVLKILAANHVDTKDLLPPTVGAIAAFMLVWQLARRVADVRSAYVHAFSSRPSLSSKEVDELKRWPDPTAEFLTSRA
jgi:hypothetical protein